MDAADAVAADTHMDRGPASDMGPSPTVGGGSLLAPDRLALWAWVFGYTAILTLLSVLRYDLWLATGFDMGMYEQGLWLIWHQGLTAASSFTHHPLLGLQAAYALIPIAALYHLSGAGGLLLLQSLGWGLGYLLLRHIGENMRLSPRSSHLVGTLYLLYPVVLGSNLFDWHPVTLGIPLIFAALDSALRRRSLACTVWLALALLTGDVLIVPVLVFGLALLMSRHTRAGLGAVVVAFGFCLLDALVILPRLGGPTAGMRAILNVAGIPTGANLWGWAHNLRGWEYLIWLLGPVAGALLVGWRRVVNPWWLPALAVIALNLATGTAAATSPFNQQSVAAVPFVFLALLAAMPRRTPARTTWLSAPALLFLAVFAWHQLRTDWVGLPKDVTALAAEAAIIPPTATLITQNHMLAHLSNRRGALLPTAALGTIPAGTYVLLEPTASTGTTPPQLLQALKRLLASQGQDTILYAKGGITLARTNVPLHLEVGSA